jgi:hypothetical protein
VRRSGSYWDMRRDWWGCKQQTKLLKLTYIMTSLVYSRIELNNAIESIELMKNSENLTDYEKN